MFFLQTVQILHQYATQVLQHIAVTDSAAIIK